MPPHRHHGAPSSAIASLIRSRDLEAVLEPWLPEEQERAFVVRCIAGEGPLHHRGASYVLLRLLGLLLEQSDGPPTVPAGDDASVPVPLRLPPHHRPHAHGEDNFPLRMPTAALERLAPRGSPELAALVDCLLDGPPHHALANAAMVCLIDALLAQRTEAKG